MDMNPLQYLAFPLLHGTNFSSYSQKSTGTSNSKTAGLLKKAKFSQSKKEADGENLSHQLLSSWHVAPIHLPLVGQNCWPHMSDGFSVSLWFHLERVREMENSTEKGKKVKRRLLSARENSFDSTGENIALDPILGSTEGFWLQLLPIDVSHTKRLHFFLLMNVDQEW